MREVKEAAAALDRVRQYWMAKLKYYYSCGAVGQFSDSQPVYTDFVDNMGWLISLFYN